jgi:hypothetical protein
MASRIEKNVDFSQKGAQPDSHVKKTNIASFFSKEKDWNKMEQFKTVQVSDGGTNSTQSLQSVDPGNLSSSVSASRDSTTVKQADSLVCPVCNVKCVEYDNDQFNRHIDACLNSSMVRNLVRQECTHKRPKKKQRLDFFK